MMPLVIKGKVKLGPFQNPAEYLEFKIHDRANHFPNDFLVENNKELRSKALISETSIILADDNG